MAKNVALMGAVFPDCPAVMLPTHEGPLARFTDVSDSQAVAADVAQGKAFYLADGTKATGTNQGGGGGGGGGGTIKPNARLVLIDYDGSIVDSYTQSEINALSALPANPDHSGDEIPLTSQGWNWTLAEIREQLTAMPEQTVWVGNVVIPSDGKTHIVIEIEEGTPESKRDMTIRFGQSVSNDVVVDWGDGSAQQTYSDKSFVNHDHAYTAPGWYDITLKPTSGTLLFKSTNNDSIYGSTSTGNLYKSARIKAVYLGSRIAEDGIGNYAFYKTKGIRKVSMPSGITTLGNYAFSQSEIESVIVPNSVTTIGQRAFFQCYSLKYALIHGQVTSLSTNAFYNSYALKAASIKLSAAATGSTAFYGCSSLGEVTLCDGTKTIPASTFSSCGALDKVIIPDSVTSIGTSAFQYCYALTWITIPGDVTSIGNSAFASCAALVEVHVKPPTPPTLGTGVFASTPSDAVIYVPYSADHSILAAYQAAENWSAYASQMQEEAE